MSCQAIFVCQPDLIKAYFCANSFSARPLAASLASQEDTLSK
jgi:hypothetical protein